MLQFLFVLTESLLYNLIKVFIGSCFNTCKGSCFNVIQEYYDTSLAGSKQRRRMAVLEGMINRGLTW